MIKNWLEKQSDYIFMMYAMTMAFGTYFCMYAYRKPFTVATYEGLEMWGVDYKILLIIAQVLGYMLSKFFGIRIISELKKDHRVHLLVILILAAELALLGFAVAPFSYKFIFLFLNGIPLGLIWGIVFSYLEGRRTSEMLGVGLCASFIVSSGFVKSIGKIVMDDWGYSEFWMPFATGVIFFLPLLIFSFFLEKIPPPSAADEAEKTKRIPMTGQQRIVILKKYFFGIVWLIGFYMMLTGYRDFRDNFAAELWEALGYGNTPAVFTLSEIPIAGLVLLALGLTMFIRNNEKAFRIYHWMLFFSTLMIGVATWLFTHGHLNPAAWMILVGLGLYVCYVPFNCILFDRMIAVFKLEGNAGFLIYIADAFGYLGSVSILLYKNFGQPDLSWLTFFVNGSYLLCIFGLILISGSYVYFFYQKQPKERFNNK
ncbi:MAG: hypothetical protein ACJAT4_000163 [Granulosicoccus sp.]|jgi:hypothetical protein